MIGRQCSSPCRHVCGLASGVSAGLQPRVSALGVPGFQERPTALSSVLVPARAGLAADLSLNVSYWLPWSTARSLNETGFRPVLNYATRIGLDGTVPCSGLKSGQKRLTGAFRRAFRPQRRAHDGEDGALLRKVGAKTLKGIAAFHLKPSGSGESQSIPASEGVLINTYSEERFPSSLECEVHSYWTGLLSQSPLACARITGDTIGRVPFLSNASEFEPLWVYRLLHGTPYVTQHPRFDVFSSLFVRNIPN